MSYGLSPDIDTHSLQMLNVAIRQSIASGERDRAFEQVGYIKVQDLGALKMGS